MSQRLQRVLASAGLGSRRACEDLIREGRVTVDGRVAELGSSVDPERQSILVDGVPIQKEPREYWLLNKPKGVVSTAKDPHGRRTVVDCVPTTARIFPVGRLDGDTTGVLLLTNDGGLAYRLLHPSFGVEKEYRMVVVGQVTEASVGRLISGIQLEDGMTAPARVEVTSAQTARSELRVSIHEGRNRQIRRMLKSVGHPVLRLHRTRFGSLSDDGLAVGAARPLNEEEVAGLRALVHLRRDVHAVPNENGYRTMRLNNALESLTAYTGGPPLRSILARYDLDDVVMLGANECPEGPFPEVIKALGSALPSLNRYPDGGCEDLRAALAGRLGVSGDRLVFGSGSCELLMLLGEALVAPGEHLLFAEPSFVVYRTIALARQASFDAVPLREHAHDLEAMAAAVRPDTRLVIVCEPNNPTGTYAGPRALRRFLDSVPPETVVVLDEAYTEYVTHPEHVDTIPWTEEYQNLVVLRTFSKIYGLAGLRIGYGVFPRDLAVALDKLRQPYNVTSLAQVAALEALRHPERVNGRREHARSERGRLARELELLGVRTVPSQANFMLVNVEGLSVPAEDVPQALLERGIVVRSGWGIGRPGWIRVSVGTVEEDDMFLQNMRELAGKEDPR